ncbi:Aminoglycoside phosphotransferase [Lasiodiplodia theobromae]|uniref:Aminoglycoside phosphotransferase n=1 Tax=Lasiodiplodia theobromae TaxID=45133 RepID=A0A8H7MBL0_9PEZI|nr:Aminoglycoside phosphotransferase [Lasiodiplodia theobromae]
MFPIKSVVDFGIPFVTTDNVSSCDPFNMQKLAILRNRRKRPNLSDSSTSLNKRRNTSNADLLPSAESKAPMTTGPSSASTLALLSNPTAIQSTATVIHTPAANASTRSVAVGPSTPPSTSSPSPKLNFFQKFTRKASRTFKKNRPAARAGNNDSSSSSGSSSGGYDAMTADTSVEPTPTRGGTLRSSTIPEVAITPTSDSSRSASPAASIRTVFRVNPYTGRPAQQYDIDFLSPRTAAAAAKARRNRARSPRPIPAGRRGGFASSSASTPASGSFPPTRAPTTVVASSSLPAGFPTRSSSLRHSNEFPFSASAADLRADDSDLYHNSGSGPSTPVKDAHNAEVPASSPTLPGSAGSNFSSLNKPLPGLPQEEAAPVAEPSASDDVFYDASPVSTTSSATIGGSSSPKTPEQAAAAAASRISLTGFPTPPTTTGHHHQQAFMHRLPPTPVTQPVPSNSPAFGFSSPILPEVGGDCYTIPPTPTPARATLATVVSGGRIVEHQSSSPTTYRLFPHQVDNHVLEARLNQIRATTVGGGGVDNADGEGEDENGGNSSAEAEAVAEDSFMLNADSDDDADMEPLISSSPLQCNRESFTSVLTQTTGISFVTAAEDVEMEDVEVDEEEEEMMNDSSLVDVDGSTLVAEGAAELSSDHQMLLSRSSTPDVENVGSDDSYVHVGDSTLDGTTLVAEVEPEPSLIANMNVDDEEAAEPEPATFQIIAKDGADTGVAVHVHAADTASTDDSHEDDAESEDVESDDEESDDEEELDDEPRIPTDDDLTDLPFLVTRTPPPELSTKLTEKAMFWKWMDWRNYCNPEWKIDIEDDVELVKETIRPYMRLCGLPSEDFNIEFLAEGRWNQVYTISALDKESGVVKECIFRCALPDLPWYRTQVEVSTMEFIRHHTSIPVPRIYAFNSSMKSPLGLEWILMEKVQGRSYADAAWAFSFETRVNIHRKVADWIDELSRIKFDKIGSLYHDWSKPLSDRSSYTVGPLNEEEFKFDLRLDYKLYRGPFSSMQQFTSSRIAFRMAEALDSRMEERAKYWEAKEKAEEEDDDTFKIDNDIETVSDPRYSLEVLKRVPGYCLELQSILPIVFADEPVGIPGHSRLAHIDIHDENIMVDDAGNLVALLDWEQTMTMPLEWTSVYPKFIDQTVYYEPEPFDIIGPRERWQAEEVMEWEAQLLRFEFDKRLKELDSPLLGEKADRKDLTTIENHLEMMRRACMDDDDDEDEVFVLGMKARARKAFAGFTGLS